MVFFASQLFQTGLGYGPLDAGLRLVPWTATFITVAPVVGKLVDRYGERPFMVGGLALQAIGTAWLAIIAEPGISYSQLLPPFLVAGVRERCDEPPVVSELSEVGSFNLLGT